MRRKWSAILVLILSFLLVSCGESDDRDIVSDAGEVITDTAFDMLMDQLPIHDDDEASDSFGDTLDLRKKDISDDTEISIETEDDTGFENEEITVEYGDTIEAEVCICNEYADGGTDYFDQGIKTIYINRDAEYFRSDIDCIPSPSVEYVESIVAGKKVGDTFYIDGEGGDCHYYISFKILSITKNSPCTL